VWCNDPILTMLKSAGYSVVRLPKADIRPLQLLSRTGKDLDRLGELSTLLVAGSKVALPPIRADVATAVVAGQRTSDLSAGVGLSILGNFLGAMGGSTLGLEANYKQAKTLSFEFQDVLADSVEVAALDQYLGAADVSPFSQHVARLLESDEIYVTTATIKSKKFVVEAKASGNKSVKLDVPVVQGTVGAKVTVSAASGSNSRLAFEGTAPLVFGFQATRLFYDQGRYTAFKFITPEEGAMRGLPRGRKPAKDPEAMKTDGLFVRLNGA
jgi:hypothetical protein